MTREALHRPLEYFVFTSVAASMIALQILFSQKRSTEYLIFFEIFLVSLSVTASAYWVFPSLVGDDPWRHFALIRDYVEIGRIESSTGTVHYLSFPVTHLNAVGAKLITALGYKESMFLGIGLPYILGTVFVYLAGSSLGTTKVGLLAALLVNLTDIHLQFGIQLMPTSLGVISFSAIFWLIVYKWGQSDARFRMLALVLLALLVVTHTMSAFVVFLFISCLLIGKYAYDVLFTEKSVSNIAMVEPLLPLLFAIEILANWTYAGYDTANSFFEAILIAFLSAMRESYVFLDRPAPLSSDEPLGIVLSQAGFVILFAFNVAGILFWFSRPHASKPRLAVIGAVVIITAIAQVFPVFGIRNIVPGRWMAFDYVLLSVIAAFAILLIAQSLSHSNHRTIMFISTTSVIAALAFFMITNGIPNQDSPIYASKMTYRNTYTETELAAGKEIESRYGGLIITDGAYATNVLDAYWGNKQPFSSDMKNKAVLDKGLVIWREVMAERPVRLSSAFDRGAGNPVLLGRSYEQELLLTRNLIYDNRSVKMFLPVSSDR